MRKIYIIRKYVIANSVEDALEKEKTTKVDDCWLEENTGKQYLEEKAGFNSRIGFGRNV